MSSYNLDWTETWLRATLAEHTLGNAQLLLRTAVAAHTLSCREPHRRGHRFAHSLLLRTAFAAHNFGCIQFVLYTVYYSVSINKLIN